MLRLHDWSLVEWSENLMSSQKVLNDTGCLFVLALNEIKLKDIRRCRIKTKLSTVSVHKTWLMKNCSENELSWAAIVFLWFFSELTIFDWIEWLAPLQFLHPLHIFVWSSLKTRFKTLLYISLFSKKENSTSTKANDSSLVRDPPPCLSGTLSRKDP